MAYMIPESPREFTPGSREGDMFHSLEKLPREYYVVHSLKTTNLVKGSLLSREADFVIFHPEKGLLVLECKGGFPQYRNGEWFYFSGDKMEHDGPYNQAKTGMHAIENAITFSSSSYLLDNLVTHYGVWFPSVARENLRKQALPPEADLSITLTTEDLADPLPAIERIFSMQKYRYGKKIVQKMSSDDVHKLLTSFICPRFDLAPSILEKQADKDLIFHRLLLEQKKLLDFLVDQPVAVVNGAAGTGKTWVALEKARRHASEGEKVLFLCYNKMLKNYLEKLTKPKGYDIDFYSIDGYACAVCNTKDSDYSLLNKELNKLFMDDKFPYQHIIIDEGQDFGQDFIEENGIMQLLCDIVTADESKEGTFYVFYDRLQTIQGKKLPKFIEDADCRLTLTRNCRNTENIAKTSLAPVTQRKPKLFELAIPGAPAQIAFCDNVDQVIKAVDTAIEQFEKQGEGDTVVLTCGIAETSVLKDKLQGGKYKGKIFTTCRKYKGLEADNVILIDVNRSTFNSKDVLRYYVGASRARTGLFIAATLDDEACSELLISQFEYPDDAPIKSPKTKLADKLCAMKIKVG